MEEGVPPEGMPVMQGYMSTAKGRRYWVLHRDGRLEAYEKTVLTRALEAAIDPEGKSSTVRAILARLS